MRHIYRQKGNAKIVAGLSFPNQVGLAAGFDKDGKYMNLMSHVGFGFIEIGTVTPKPQDGNPQPRLFRLPEDRALINRMGFNNDGLAAMVRRLEEKRPTNVILGANIGKNKVTPNDRAVEDYIICFKELHDLVDYFVVNVSSPNTPGLRELQEKGPLLNILSSLQEINNQKQIQRPIFLKIAPDLNDDQIRDIASIVNDSGIAGVVATNTTISRENLNTDSQKVEAIGAGGLSGAPVEKRSTEVITQLRNLLADDKAIIGVGGVDSLEAARKKVSAGADLIQIYSGMIYEGPGLISQISSGL